MQQIYSAGSPLSLITNMVFTTLLSQLDLFFTMFKLYVIFIKRYL